jgi:hypothetical protein
MMAVGTFFQNVGNNNTATQLNNPENLNPELQHCGKLTS